MLNPKIIRKYDVIYLLNVLLEEIFFTKKEEL